MSEDSPRYFDLKPPEVPLSINMQSPDFEKLTSAEKLNDSSYRSLIYRTFPNEPICTCSKDPRFRGRTSGRDCPGNCKNNCCRRNQSTAEVKNNGDSCGSRRGGDDNRTHCPLQKVRLRGGGCEDLYRKWEDLDNSRIPRFDNPLNCSPSNYIPNYYYTSTENFSSKIRNPLDATRCRANPRGCGEGPCIGADCFLRTLRETQEFVDSLGKTPGLAGLGLEDPSESPYFRMKELALEEVESVPIEGPKMNKKCARGHGHQRNQRGDDSMVIKTKPFTLASAAKRDPFSGLPPLSSNPLSYNLEKSEEPPEDGMGPCGESCCRSRRKRKPVTPSSHEIVKSKEKERRGSRRSFQQKRLKGRKNRGVIPVNTGVELRDSRRRIKYVYLAGDSYPGLTIGHKHCSIPRKRVPAKMGWLWNEHPTSGRLKPRVGWRPGALSRTLKEIIKEIRAGALEDSRSRSAHSRSRLKNRSQTSMRKTTSKRLDEEEEEPPPTLHILRRDGTYYVTMYPIKQETMEVPQLEEPMKPLQFKIVKDRDDSDSGSSTASDIEIEFSPPAAVNRYRRQPDVVHVDIQVKQQEIIDAFKDEGEKKKEKKGKKGKK
ncbi:uncharacterized protein [Fopius arisanus]|uniref:Rps5p protein n=1 Tax=Fopius arisanus TaxID=64838 RepID=A0A0C9R7Z8_9HYME|nr:PREDICTED: uncharacterized protein LOC105270673 [Fopius arisanus]